MIAEIIVMEDCASNYGTFEVEGSKGKKYQVTLSGSEGPAHCTCPAFKFSGERQTCKHVEKVLNDACLFNPQWHDAKDGPQLRPIGYNYDAFTGSQRACGGPMVAVRRAV
jgi:hypothetical protein